MKQGFIKVAASAFHGQVADVEHNTLSLSKCILDAHNAGAHLLVLPELCVTSAIRIP